jgi:hypothetical protein
MGVTPAFHFMTGSIDRDVSGLLGAEIMNSDLMKGALFVHLVEFSQAQLGYERVEQVLAGLKLANGGAYTSVGMYPVSDFMNLQGEISAQLNITVDDFSPRFGRYLILLLAINHVNTENDHPFDFLERVHGTIHVSVRKIYLNANPPAVEVVERVGNRSLLLRYSSHRPLASFCGGMLEGALNMFSGRHNYVFERRDAEPRTETAADFYVFEGPEGGSHDA